MEQHHPVGAPHQHRGLLSRSFGVLLLPNPPTQAKLYCSRVPAGGSERLPLDHHRDVRQGIVRDKNAARQKDLHKVGSGTGISRQVQAVDERN